MILIKSEIDCTSPYMALLKLRAMSLDDNAPSLAWPLGNRRYKTTLPAVTKAPYNSEEVRQSLSRMQEYDEHDAHVKELQPLLPQQT